MDLNRKESIAASFPSQHTTAELGMMLSAEQFEPFREGIYAGSMDEKWNIFMLNDILYFSRSWTDNCIFKVYTESKADSVLLKSVDFSNDASQYRFKEIQEAVDLVKWVIQLYLSWQEAIDPKLKLPFIRDIIKKEDPENDCSKTVGSRTVAQAHRIYNELNSSPNNEQFTLRGWEELKQNLLKREDKEAIISVYLSSKQMGITKTLYFSQTADELLGSIIIDKIKA
ncbi:hypothetical protein [Mucilaginibacter pedocola]|uniref:Uncharacterized protein n=1 Tax=Mucilaginibacter pedocola TaxID=1792845 RepID=A0A1S9PKB8_9SPHI|nr:hypothetical protein [Mucilaginibacter pedocola]OOQ61406.1 hypothetical protein BC343_20760 [Mucilaginibacter pedocola]